MSPCIVGVCVYGSSVNGCGVSSVTVSATVGRLPRSKFSVGMGDSPATHQSAPVVTGAMAIVGNACPSASLLSTSEFATIEMAMVATV